jgi:protein involved in polysaccharide export with SLBB domain
VSRVFFVLLSLLWLCAAPTLARQESDYILDTDDVISIDVQRHPDVTKILKVPADGKLRLPRLKNPVTVRGLTCAGLVTKLTDVLQTEGKLRLRPGQVQVSLQERRPRRVYLRGNAVGGTQLDLINNWRVSELLAAAGRTFQPERVTVILTNPRRPQPLPINLSAIEKTPDGPENLTLQEGDTLTINLPRPKRLFVTGIGVALGEHELDERFGLRRALIKLGVIVRDNPGDLKRVVIKRKKVPGDPNAEEVRIPVDVLQLLTDDSVPEVPLMDLDTLDVPASNRFVYAYLADQQARKILLPEDRKTHLFDLVTMIGGIPGPAKTSSISLWRGLADGKPQRIGVDLQRFLQKGDRKGNPEIQPEDVVVISPNRRIDPFQTLWQGVGLAQALQFFRGLRL